MEVEQQVAILQQQLEEGQQRHQQLQREHTQLEHEASTCEELEVKSWSSTSCNRLTAMGSSPMYVPFGTSQHGRWV